MQRVGVVVVVVAAAAAVAAVAVAVAVVVVVVVVRKWIPNKTHLDRYDPSYGSARKPPLLC